LLRQDLEQTDCSVGTAIEGMAARGIPTLAHHGRVSAKQSRRFRIDLEQCSQPASLSQIIDLESRSEVLWLIGRFPFMAPEEWENELGVAEALQDIMHITRSKKGKVDWNEVLRICNRHFDSVLVAHKIKSRSARTRRLEEIANQAEAKLDGVRMDWLSFVDRDLFFKKVTERASPKERAPLIAALFITTFDMSKSCAAVHDRGQCVADQARLALALAGFRAENGKYPDRLVELVPKYISPIPDDMYSEKPFVYRREGSAYVLKSVGPNGDEEQPDEYPNDDITIVTNLNVPVRDKGMMLTLRELGVEMKFGSIDFSDTQVADADLAQLADVAELYS